GYSAMFSNLLDHPLIRVELATDFFLQPSIKGYRHIVYTGPIDAYFKHCLGRLPYRSLRFEHEHISATEYQEVGTVNFPNDYAFTRITEFKHLTGQDRKSVV